MLDGAGNDITGCPRSAPLINCVQILAGKDPPVTDVIPPIPLSDCVALSLKKETDAAICGV
jgi:hypothetical protein